MVHNPINITQDETLVTGSNASIVSPTIEDGVTITIEPDAALVIL